MEADHAVDAAEPQAAHGSSTKTVNDFAARCRLSSYVAVPRKSGNVRRLVDRFHDAFIPLCQRC